MGCKVLEISIQQTHTKLQIFVQYFRKICNYVCVCPVLTILLPWPTTQLCAKLVITFGYNVRVHAHVCVCVCVYVSLYACVHACVCVCVCVCVYSLVQWNWFSDHCQQCNDTHTNDYLLFCPGTWRRSFSACNTFRMCSYFGILLNRCRCRLTLC